jgi:hypothetical protein
MTSNTRLSRSATVRALASALLIGIAFFSPLLSFTPGTAAGHHVTKHPFPGLPSTVSDAKVYNVFWSLHWNTDSPHVSQEQIDGMTRQLLGSSFLGGAHQYGVNGAVLDGSYQDFHNRINCKPRYTTSTSKAGILGYLLCNVSNPFHHLPKPDGHKIYILYLPPKTDISDDHGCNSYAAYHSFLPYLTGTALYAVIPLKCNSSLGAIENSLSHELAETMTNPVGAGWYEGGLNLAKFFANDGEVGDICDSANAPANYIAGLELDAYWSNADNACVASDLGALVVESFNVSISAGVATASAVIQNNGSSSFTASSVSLGVPASTGKFIQGFTAQSNVTIPAGGIYHYSASRKAPLIRSASSACYAMEIRHTAGGTYSAVPGWITTPGVCLTLDSAGNLTQSAWHS